VPDVSVAATASQPVASVVEIVSLHANAVAIAKLIYHPSFFFSILFIILYFLR